MVMIELSESEKARALPPPTFSAPFTSPSLRWARKKRLRCFHPDADAALRPSPDHHLHRHVPSLDHDGPACAASTVHSSANGSPPPASVYGSRLASLSSPRSEDDDAEEAPDLSPRPAAEEGRVTDEGRRRGSDAAGWSLRSGVRNPGEKRKRRRRVELWVSLSRDEIEEDFLWMTGSKPPQRSRRRDRAASDHLLSGVFPGSWMPNRVTAARYRVTEPSDARKG